MNRKLFTCLIIFLPLYSVAQSIDQKQEYEAFKRQAIAKYVDFRSKANAEYAEFVKKAWKQFKVQPAIPKPKDETTPPVTVPKEDRNDERIDDRNVPIKDVVTTPEPEPQPVPVSPIRGNRGEADRYVTFSYCGTECKVRFRNDTRLRLAGCSNDCLSEAWTELSKDDYNNTIRDCLELREKMQLSDWAYLNMLNAFAEKCMGKGNEALMLTAFIYGQSGYKMRIGRVDGRICLLFSSRHGIYDLPYFNVDGEKFYQFNSKTAQMEICTAAYPNEKPLSLFITQPQLFAYAPTQLRTLTEESQNRISVKVQVNKNLLDFYSSYPSSEIDGNFMTRWAIYANTPMSYGVKEELYSSLKRQISGLGQLESVNKLLNWVQTAFKYEYDDKVWGHDRAFFAEETLYYPYCDCEDRAILFTRLVRDLLGLKCILVYYPGHLAAAVCFTDEVKGDYILFEGNRYVIADPTYIGAPVGKTMPNMNNMTADVILLDN